MIVNHKRVERLYREEGLAVRRRRRKRVARDGRGRAAVPGRPNQQWGVDFVSDTLAWGRRIRLFTVVDVFTQEVLAIEVDTSLPGGRVVRVLERLAAERGAPDEIVQELGPELAGKTVDQWAYGRGVRLRFIEPGKPIQNAFVERFQGRLRDECLDRHWFVSLPDARHTIEAWRQDYNRARPHSALGYRPPEEFRRVFEVTALMQQEWIGLSEYVDQTTGAGQNNTEAQALIVPSIGLLDQLDHWVMVVYVDKIPGYPDSCITAIARRGTLPKYV